MRLLFAGLDKMRQKGGDGFGFEWIEKSMQPIVDDFVGNPDLPGFTLKPYAVVLPYALLISGLLVTSWPVHPLEPAGRRPDLHLPRFRPDGAAGRRPGCVSRH